MRSIFSFSKSLTKQKYCQPAAPQAPVPPAAAHAQGHQQPPEPAPAPPAAAHAQGHQHQPEPAPVDPPPAHDQGHQHEEGAAPVHVATPQRERPPQAVPQPKRRRSLLGAIFKTVSDYYNEEQ